MYLEIRPSEGLPNLIDSFWTFSNNKEHECFKVLPDTCMDLIFDLNRSKGFLSGIMTKYQPRELAAESDLIGVRFKTEKFGLLCKIPVQETKNLRVELSHIFPVENENILNHLSNLDTITEKLSLLENFISKLSKQNQLKQDGLILSVVQVIRSLNGSSNIGELAKSHHISLRQLERRFKRHIGLTIKEFSNIVRFTKAKKAITNFKESSLLEIAFDMGFFDHSHMNHEFKRISGENPSCFR